MLIKYTPQNKTNNPMGNKINNSLSNKINSFLGNRINNLVGNKINNPIWGESDVYLLGILPEVAIHVVVVDVQAIIQSAGLDARHRYSHNLYCLSLRDFQGSGCHSLFFVVTVLFLTGCTVALTTLFFLV